MIGIITLPRFTSMGMSQKEVALKTYNGPWLERNMKGFGGDALFGVETHLDTLTST